MPVLDRPARCLIPPAGMLVAVLVVCLPPTMAAEPHAVDTIDARQIAGELATIDDVAVTMLSGGERIVLARRQVSSISLAPVQAADGHAESTLVVARTDEVFPATQVAAADGSLTLQSPLLGQVQLELSDVEAIFLPRRGMTPAQIRQESDQRRLAAREGDAMVVIRGADDWLAVHGVLERIEPTRLAFRWRGEQRTIARQSVPVIWLGAVATVPPRPAASGQVRLLDGTTVFFSELVADAETVTIRSPRLGERRVARASVGEIRFATDMTFLTDLTPVEVRERGFFTTTFPHRLNRSVGGGPLRLGGRTFERGLGLHSFCELVYELGGQYETFVALVGIDDAVRPRGDASLELLGDGEPLVEPMRLTGQTQPEQVRVGVRGVGRLTIRVGFGEDGLDVADHVNLAGARLLKAPPAEEPAPASASGM